MAKTQKLSPMMQQYMDIKENYRDCILFFRLGDFYEMFFDDATTASRELELTLTGKNCGMVGTPTSLATILDFTLSPRLSIITWSGPMNTIPAASHALAKSTFSARNP